MSGRSALNLWETIMQVVAPEPSGDCSLSRASWNWVTRQLSCIPEITVEDMVDYIPPSLSPWKGRTFLKILEDNDPVIQMVIKSRDPKL